MAKEKHSEVVIHINIYNIFFFYIRSFSPSGFWIDDFNLGYEDNFILIFDWVLNKITCFYLWAFLTEKKVTCLGFLNYYIGIV